MTLAKAVIVLAFCSAINALSVGKNFSMVLVGGGLEDDNVAVWSTIISLAGGKGVAKIGVISAASENPCCDEESSWYYYSQQFLLYGAYEVYYIPVTVDTTENNTNPEVIANIRRMSGFFFGGGDQLRIVESFYNGADNIASPALLAIRETLLATGGVVGGTSAGTDIQTGNVMITGGESYEGVVEGVKIDWRPIELPTNTVTAYAHGGISYFPYGLLDTHFENRGRIGRMIRLLADSSSYPLGATRAFGIDENTALVVTGPWNHRIGSVIGQRGVSIMDTSLSTVSEETDKYWSISNVKVSHITDGDMIDFTTFELTCAPFKQPLKGVEHHEHAEISKNIFAADLFEFNKVATSLFDSFEISSYGETIQKSPTYVVNMSKEWNVNEGVVAAGFGGVHPESGEYVISYHAMNVEIVVKQ